MTTKNYVKRFFIFLFFIGFSISGYCIKDPIKFGKVSLDELKMKTYSKDTSATAIYLCDYGVSDINFQASERDFKYTFTKTIRIKILKEEGFHYSDFKISYNKKIQKINQIKACTYNLENGKIVKTKLSSKDKILEKTSENVSTYKLTLPNVKIGSVIEFKYQITSDLSYNLRTWYFQHQIPSLHSELRARIPEYFSYKKNHKGYLNLAINEHTYSTGNIDKTSFNVDNFRWVMKDIPAFKDEPYTTTRKNYLSAIEFELEGITDFYGVYRNKTGSWEKINKDLLKHQYFGEQLKGGNFLKDEVAKIQSKYSTKKEQLLAAFEFIKNYMTWNDYYGKYVTNTLRSAFKEKKGNCADINLMLVVLLKKLGLEADPIILSTRNNGLLSLTSPSLTKFNYVIASCKIDGNRILLDATEQYCAPNMLPLRCINDKGRLISSPGTFFVDIESKTTSQSMTRIKATLNDEGVISGNINLAYTGNKALKERSRFNSKTEDEILELIDEEYTSMNVESAEIHNLSDLGKRFLNVLEVEMVDELDMNSELIYINPFLMDQIKSNPFTLEERKYPVDYGYAFDDTYMIELTIPKGYRLESKPAPCKIALPEKSGFFMFSANQLNNKITIVCKTKINKRQFQYFEYKSLKEFYNLIVAKQAEMLVLKKS